MDEIVSKSFIKSVFKAIRHRNKRALSKFIPEFQQTCFVSNCAFLVWYFDALKIATFPKAFDAILFACRLVLTRKT